MAILSFNHIVGNVSLTNFWLHFQVDSWIWPPQFEIHCVAPAMAIYIV